MEQWIANFIGCDVAPGGPGGALAIPPERHATVDSCRRIATATELHDSLAPGGARLCFVIAGEWSVVSSRDAERAGPGTAVLIGPSDRAGGVSTTGGAMIVVELSAGGWLRHVTAPAYVAANRLFRLTAAEPGSLMAHPVGAPGEPLRLNPGAAAPRPATRDRLVRGIAAALDADTLPTVDRLAQRTGVSGRTLHRCCIDTFGFGPMTLLKRERLLRTLQRMREVQSRKIAEIIPFDYFDQSHFNRDFKAFMGATPTEYRRRAGHPFAIATHAAPAFAAAP